MYPGSLHNQGPAPPMASGPYAPLGSGYPQGGPGAPAAKPFMAPAVAPPTTGRSDVARHVTDVLRNLLLMVIGSCSAVHLI